MSREAAASDPFHRTGQQRRAALFGMHVFLGTEIMMFGSLFAVIAINRYLHPETTVEMSRKLHAGLGAVNTAILLTSSLLVAVAVVAAERGRRRLLAWCLALAAVLGTGFLGLKAYEYLSEYREGLFPAPGGSHELTKPAERLFMDLYVTATSLHALHLTVGIILIGGLALAARLKRLEVPRRSILVQNIALYWHLVDLIWVFLYPTLYLVR